MKMPPPEGDEWARWRRLSECLEDVSADGPDTGALQISDFLTVKIRRLARAMDRETKQMLARFDLSVIEWRCLALLSHRGDLSAVQLSKLTGFDKSQISRALQSLAGRGLVRKLGANSGPKAVMITATEAGGTLYRQILPIGRARQRRLLGLLTVEQRHTLYAAVDILGLHLNEHWERSLATVPADRPQPGTPG